MSLMTGGQAVVESLKAHSVDTVFGIISIHTLDLFDALFHNQDDIRFVGGRMELGCGYMADGYFRATGQPGILLTSTGPGAADSIGALGEAYFSSSSVLEITTNVEQEFINAGRLITHETKDQPAMFQSVTDWNAQIERTDAIPDYFIEAFRRFRSRRPRPIGLEIPTNLLGEKADIEILQDRPADPPKGDPNLVEKALSALMDASRPVIFVGEEMQALGGTPEIISLAERIGAPVVTADGAKGAFPEDHPLSLGPALGGRIWGSNPVQAWISSCDVALVLGAILPYRSTVGVQLQLPETVVHVLLDGEAIGKNYAADIPIVANSKEVINQFLDCIGNRDVYKGEAYRQEIACLKQHIYNDLKRQWPNSLRTFEAIRSVTPKDAIFSLDATVPTSRAIRCLTAYQPRTFMYPHGWLGLGFAYAASIGAKIGMPKSPVICVTGDGGFQYNMQELATAAQYGVDVTVVMFNDSSWGVLKKQQQERYDGRVFATDLVNPDFIKLFDSYGFEGVRVHTVDELTHALEMVSHSNQTTLVEVQIPRGFDAFD